MCAPAKTQISLGIHPVWSKSSLSAWRKLGSLATLLNAHAQADLSLRYAHSSFCWFCHTAAHIWATSEGNLSSAYETVNFSEKFQVEIAEFLRENMTLYRQNLKISGRKAGNSWRKYWICWRHFPLFPPEKQKQNKTKQNKTKKNIISPWKKAVDHGEKIKSGNFLSLHLHCKTQTALLSYWD